MRRPWFAPRATILWLNLERTIQTATVGKRKSTIYQTAPLANGHGSDSSAVYRVNKGSDMPTNQDLTVTKIGTLSLYQEISDYLRDKVVPGVI